mgnify:FL=1
MTEEERALRGGPSGGSVMDSETILNRHNKHRRTTRNAEALNVHTMC